MASKKIPQKTNSVKPVSEKAKNESDTRILKNPTAKGKKKASKKAVVKLKKNSSEVKKDNRGRNGVNEEELVLKLYYDEEIPKGLNNIQLAAYIGIGESTFYEILSRNKDFKEAVSFYRGNSHLEVLKAFKKTACGFQYDEVKRELRKDQKTGEYNLKVTEIVTKQVAPNPTASIFYLKNKMSNHFKDKTETVHSAGNGLENIT
jgi:hypothetical protein